MRCAVVLVALERYRQAKKDWPPDLNAVGRAGLLHAVPQDPYDGAPLRYRRDAEGVVIYSVGWDSQDNNGQPLDDTGTDPNGTDIGLRLWNAALRRK
jgi:hypothetical protein